MREAVAIWATRKNPMQETTLSLARTMYQTDV
jgi:hypothetical protein